MYLNFVASFTFLLTIFIVAYRYIMVRPVQLSWPGESDLAQPKKNKNKNPCLTTAGLGLHFQPKNLKKPKKPDQVGNKE